MKDKIKAYLEEIKQYLKPLGKEEQEDIIKELQATIMEMQQKGIHEEEIIQRLGTPTNMAKAYLADLLVKEKFSWRKCVMYFTFYTMTGFFSIMIIPIVLLLMLHFGITSITNLVLSLFKLLDSLFAWHTEFASHLTFQMLGLTLSPFIGFIASIVYVGVAIWMIQICSKGLEMYFETLRSLKNEMKI